MTTLYELEWQRQRAREDVPKGHLPVHRWYLRLQKPWHHENPKPLRDGITVSRVLNPTVPFYRYLYHTAGEEFIWGDRRRIGDEELNALISNDHIHLMVLYDKGQPAGFFELDFGSPEQSEIKYFALLPHAIGGGLGRYLLNWAIHYAGQRKVPLVLDTCTLDHSSALLNYQARGFEIYAEDNSVYPDPRLDGTIPRKAGEHVPLAD